MLEFVEELIRINLGQGIKIVQLSFSGLSNVILILCMYPTCGGNKRDFDLSMSDIRSITNPPVYNLHRVVTASV